MEEWRPIVNYEGLYSVSNHGRIRRDNDCRWNQHKSGAIIACKKYPCNRYMQTVLTKHGNKKSFTIHSIVARAFLGERPKGFTVNHKDTNRYNNFSTNLEYITLKDNIRHAHKNGIGARGERVNLAKLTEKKVIEIRNKHIRGNNQHFIGYSYAMLAKEYGVHKTCIANIIHRKTWKHI